MFQFSFGHLIKDTVHYVNSLRSTSFSHTYRQDNSVANALAKKVRFSFALTIWMESVPLDINTFVLAAKSFS